ncbi:MAG TPA: hypothetical protein VF836_07165 [Gemmatimonadaceae bacterium]
MKRGTLVQESELGEAGGDDVRSGDLKSSPVTRTTCGLTVGGETAIDLTVECDGAAAKARPNENVATATDPTMRPTVFTDAMNEHLSIDEYGR